MDDRLQISEETPTLAAKISERECETPEPGGSASSFDQKERDEQEGRRGRLRGGGGAWNQGEGRGNIAFI